MRASAIEAPNNTGLADFPATISIADLQIGASAFASGNDIVFTDTDEFTVLASEIERFDPADGTLVAWVKVPFYRQPKRRGGALYAHDQDTGVTDMFKVFAFLAKRADIETAAFIEYYENHHVPLVRSLAPAPLVYKRNYLSRGHELNREDVSIDFDVITELVFADRAAFLEWIQKLSVDEIGADEARFLDRSRTRSYVIDERGRP